MLHPMRMVTIVCEKLAQRPLETLLAEVGAHGCTIFDVAGRGAGGARGGGPETLANVQMEIILQPAAADVLLARLERDFFPRFGMIAFESDVRVLRPQKF